MGALGQPSTAGTYLADLPRTDFQTTNPQTNTLRLLHFSQISQEKHPGE